MRIVLALLFFLSLTLPRQGLAQDQMTAPATASGGVQIVQPLDHALVRENVSVKLRDFPSGGYVSVSIDGQFRAASALPQSPGAAVYTWDTKAPYATPDDPNTPKYYADGSHTLTLSLFDAASKPLGTASVTVQVANQINLPSSQGIKLTYAWQVGQKQRYQRRTLLAVLPQDAAPGATGQPVQQSLVRFTRSVENQSARIYTIRDEVLPTDRSFISYVVNKGLPQSVQAAYNVRSKYRMVDGTGSVQAELASLGPGDHYSFSIPILPSHRISVGAHWSSPVHVSLDWASESDTELAATSTLEGFEWQDHYPTAKIRETYVGPAIFHPQSNSPLPMVTSQSVKFERLVYFAYNQGRVVHMTTTMEVPVDSSSAPFSIATTPTQSSAGPAAFGGGSGDTPSSGMPQTIAMPGNPMMPMMPGMPGNPNSPFNPNNPNNPNRMRPQSPTGTPAAQNVPVKLEYTDATALI